MGRNVKSSGFVVGSLATIFAGLVQVSAYAVPAENKVIYGSDGRVEAALCPSSSVKAKAKSTLAMIPKANLTKQADGSYRLSSSTLGDMGLCPSERFYSQPTAANCSGFLLSGQTAATAGHCITGQDDCDGNYWVLDYATNTSGVMSKTFRADQVYRCSKVLKSVLNSSNLLDYAVIKLDRPTGRPGLAVRKSGFITAKTPIYVIGNPSGLPTKVAGGASVRKTRYIYFTANLDTFGGNSGSAVFNNKTGLVEGILVRGEVDYVQSGNCVVPKRCSLTGCRGEDVTKITRVKY